MTIENTTRYFKLVYFQGTKQDDKIFPFNGGLRDAITRGRKHCEVMNYRFGVVKPAIVDLDHQEKLKFSDPEWNERLDEYETSKVDAKK